MTPTSKSAGIYSALDPNSRHVRLVSLRPGRWSDRIDCHLEQADLDLQPKFEALSYVWGCSTETQSIRLNGCEVTVTDNLYCALRRLRLLHDPRTLWVDQLAINQDDIDERGQQVALMNIIYGKAAHVILWLGEEVDRLLSYYPPAPFHIPRTQPGAWVLGPFAVNVIGDYCRFKADPIHAAGVENRDDTHNEPDYIYHAFRLVASLARMKVHLRDQPYFIENSSDSGNPRFNENVFRTLDFLMRRPWWTRMWILQECVLSDDATVTYGPTAAPLVVFVWASRFYRLHSGTCCADFHRQLPKWQIDILDHFYRTMADIYRPWDSRRRYWRSNLEATLRLSRNRQAFDDRDKVYGLLGLSLNWHGTDPIIPNYRLEAPQIYQATTLKLIQMEQTLSVLGDCIHNNDSSYSTLPSWVVKWNIPETYRSTGMSLYRACADTEAVSARMVSDTVLCLSGFKVDTIRRVEHAMDVTKSQQEISSVFRSWKHLAAESTAYAASPPDTGPVPIPVDDDKSSNSTSLGWRDAFWRTLCGDTCFVPGPLSDSGLAIRRAKPSDRVAFMAWCNQREPALAEDAVSQSTGGQVTSSAQPLDEFQNKTKNKTKQKNKTKKPLDEGMSAVMDMTIRNASTRKRMFMTDRGYIGLAPPRVKEGDHLFILHGGSAPFLLRDAGEEELEGVPGRQRYMLLGMCYVHGIMDGEAMRWGLQEDDVYLV